MFSWVLEGQSEKETLNSPGWKIYASAMTESGVLRTSGNWG